MGLRPPPTCIPSRAQALDVAALLGQALGGYYAGYGSSYNRQRYGSTTGGPAACIGPPPSPLWQQQPAPAEPRGG